MRTNILLLFSLCLLGNLLSIPVTTVANDEDENDVTKSTEIDPNNANVGKEVTSSEVESQMVYLKKNNKPLEVQGLNDKIDVNKKVRIARQEPDDDDDEDDDDDDLIDIFADDDDSDDDEGSDSAAAVKEEEDEEEEDDIFSVLGSLLDDDDEDDEESDNDSDKTSVSVTLSQPVAHPETQSDPLVESDLANSIDQNEELSSNEEDDTRIKNSAGGEKPALISPNPQSVQSNAQAISSTNTNSGNSDTVPEEEDDDDDDDDDDDEELVLDDDDDDDDDEDDDDDDEGDIESAILDARQARTLNNDENPNSVSVNRYPVQIDKFNKLFDTVVGRLNKELKKKYDPAVVKLTSSSKRKNSKSKSKKKSKIRSKSETDSEAAEQSTLPKAVEDHKDVPKESLRSSKDKEAKQSNNKKKSKNNSNTKATLYGLASLRRINDMKVNVRSDYTMVNGDFAFGPLVLRVEKEYGKGLQRDIRSATASTEEMYGTLKLKLSTEGVAKLQSIKVYQPKLVRIESDGNHDKTREFLWKRSSDIAPIVSRTLSNVAKSLMSEKDNSEKLN